jgi:hypothetical protein
MGMGSQRHTLAALPTGAVSNSHRGSGWVGLRTGLGGVRMSRSLPGFDHRTVQPVTVQNTDCSVSAPLNTRRQSLNVIDIISCTVGHAQAALYYSDKLHLMLILYRAAVSYFCVIIMAYVHGTCTYIYLYSISVILNIS